MGLEERQLLRWPTSVEEDVWCGSLRHNAQLLQRGQVMEPGGAPGFEDGIRAFRTDARDAQELTPLSPVQLDRSVSKIELRPGQFGIALQGQVSIPPKGQVFQIEAIVAE